MERVKRIMKAAREKIVRRVFWLPQSQVDLITAETKKRKLPNDSALLRTIVANWFEN